MQDSTVVDAKVAELLQAGLLDEAMKQVLDNYKEGVFGFLFRELQNRAQTEDLYSAVIASAWEHLATLRLDSDDGKKRSVRAWLYCIARRKLRDWRKRHSRHNVTPLKTGQDFIRDTPGLETQKQNEQIGRRIASALEKLTEDQRDAFILFYEREFSMAEVGEVLGISENAAKNRCYRANQVLREHLAELAPALAK